MCGIAAVCLRPAHRGRADELVTAALARLAHRGPDGTGVVGWSHTALGMSRLRVRSAPLDEVPFTDPDSGTVFAFNGEVYRDGASAPTGGCAEARSALAAGGRPGAVDGMYAVVGADAEQTLRVSRDPLGIKPLYLRESVHGAAVASELPALLHTFGPARIRPAAVAQFLLTCRRVVDGGTFFEDIRPVAPGESLTIRAGEVVQSAVAQSAVAQSAVAQSAVAQSPQPGPFEPPEPARIEDALVEAVDRMLLADRRIGLALSGGLDSTSIAAILSRRGVRDLPTVSLLPEGTEDGISDLDRLGLTGGSIGSWQHASIPFGPSELLDGLSASVRAFGEPMAMTSAPMYAALARLAAKSGITVLLVGEGADELFGGYHRYRAAYAGALADPLDFYLSAARLGLVTELLGPGPAGEAVEALRAALTRAEAAVRARRSGTVTAAEVVREFEYVHSLEPLLRRTDHLLMAEGIEGRTPFLHADLPALARSYPPAALLADGHTKAVLRKAMANLVPAGCRYQTKRPFRAPVGQWHEGPLRSAVDRALTAGAQSLRDRLGVRPEGLRVLRQRAAAGHAGAASMTFALLATVEWLTWLDLEADAGAKS